MVGDVGHDFDPDPDWAVTDQAVPREYQPRQGRDGVIDHLVVGADCPAAADRDVDRPDRGIICRRPACCT